MGLEVHQDGIKLAYSLEWRSADDSREIETNINLMFNSKKNTRDYLKLLSQVVIELNANGII